MASLIPILPTTLTLPHANFEKRNPFPTDDSGKGWRWWRIRRTYLNDDVTPTSDVGPLCRLPDSTDDSHQRQCQHSQPHRRTPFTTPTSNDEDAKRQFSILVAPNNFPHCSSQRQPLADLQLQLHLLTGSSDESDLRVAPNFSTLTLNFLCLLP